MSELNPYLLPCEACAGHGEIDNPKWLAFAAANPEPKRDLEAAYLSPEWLAWEQAHDAYTEACRTQIITHGTETLACKKCGGTGRVRFDPYLIGDDEFAEAANRFHAALEKHRTEDNGEYGKPPYTRSQVFRALDAFLREKVGYVIRDRDMPFCWDFEERLKFEREQDERKAHANQPATSGQAEDFGEDE